MSFVVKKEPRWAPFESVGALSEIVQGLSDTLQTQDLALKAMQKKVYRDGKKNGDEVSLSEVVTNPTPVILRAGDTPPADYER